MKKPKLNIVNYFCGMLFVITSEVILCLWFSTSCYVAKDISVIEALLPISFIVISLFLIVIIYIEFFILFYKLASINLFNNKSYPVLFGSFFCATIHLLFDLFLYGGYSPTSLVVAILFGAFIGMTTKFFIPERITVTVYNQ